MLYYKMACPSNLELTGTDRKILDLDADMEEGNDISTSVEFNCCGHSVPHKDLSDLYYANAFFALSGTRLR